MIGNPFAFPISWHDVILPEDHLVSNSPRVWDRQTNGYLTNESILKPWKGFFVYNGSSARVQIEIPPIEAPANAIDSPLPFIASYRLQEGEWVVQLTVEGEHFTDSHNYLGSLSTASMGWDVNDLPELHRRGFSMKCAPDSWDVNDLPELPIVGDYLSLSFPHAEWQIRPDEYTNEFKPITNEGHVWEFQVTSTIAKTKLKLRIANIRGVPDDWEMILYDQYQAQKRELDANNSYSFVIQNVRKPRHFKLFIGEREYINKITNELNLRPENFALFHNYPNPFNPSTQILYNLASATDVELIVYDINGNLVRDLVHQNQKEGSYEIVWDGKNELGQPVSSGVYIVYLKAGSHVFRKKALLVK